MSAKLINLLKAKPVDVTTKNIDMLIALKFAINESKIDDSITDGKISIPGFNLIRKDRNRAGGGVVLYIRVFVI